MISFRNSRDSLGKVALIQPTTLILLIALSERPVHGYRLMRDIGDMTRGTIQPRTATVYHSLRRMCSEGLIEENSDGDARQRVTDRREYRITEFGLRVAKTEVERLAIVLETAKQRGLLETPDSRNRQARLAR